MRFQVPQFIDIEEKVLGPLTFTQFIYLAGGAGFAVVCWVLMPKFLAFFVGSLGIVFALVLTFYKVNNRPFAAFLEHALRYGLGRRLYIWRKVDKKPVPHEAAPIEDASLSVPRLSDSRLKDLAWSLDVHDASR